MYLILGVQTRARVFRVLSGQFGAAAAAAVVSLTLTHFPDGLAPGMSRHLAPLLLLLISLLGSQTCQATVEKKGGQPHQGLGSVQEQKDSEGTQHGEGRLKDLGGGGGGHGGGVNDAGVHSEAGHHGEVRKYLDSDQSKQPATRCIAKFASANSSVSGLSQEFVNGSSDLSQECVKFLQQSAFVICHQKKLLASVRTSWGLGLAKDIPTSRSIMLCPNITI